MRKTFDEQLDEISQDLISMGSLVQNAVSDSLQAFIEMNTDLAKEVMVRDEKINEYDILIEEKSIILIAEYQPVAKDLRLLHSISIMIKNLERIGDLAVNISKVVRRISDKKPEQVDKDVIDLVVEMGNLVKPELARAMEAFKNKDARLASKLGKSDKPVNEIQKMIFRRLFTIRKKKDIKFLTNIALVSRYLERIGDQSVNIGDRVFYLLTGDYTVFHERM